MLSSITIHLLLLLTPTFGARSQWGSSSFESKLVERTLQFKAVGEETTHTRRLVFTEPRKYTKPYQQSSETTSASDTSGGCDKAFFKCLDSKACTECFLSLKSYDVDWAGVTVETECEVIVDALQSNAQHFCQSLGKFDSADAKVFCSTFHSCVYFDDEDEADHNLVDCEKLTECDWPGIKKSYVGDGVCHNNFQGGCYNSKACNFDGGDCCQDTCNSLADSYLKCGTDGYLCRDPKSKECDPTATIHCPPDPDSDDEDSVKPPKCARDETLYKLTMKDSFGDGWENTTLSMHLASDDSSKEPFFKTSLKDGFTGTEYVCLSRNATCYRVDTAGGVWGREASWSISGASPGAPAVASGGGHTNCKFPIAGDSCEDTCLGKNNKDPTTDPSYKEFKDMYHCIEEKCGIQSESCKKDASCKRCFENDVIPDDCYTVPAFKAVTDCTVCKCSKVKDNAFCESKAAPGQCSTHEVAVGGQSVIEFSQCMNGYDQTSILMTHFDQNKFDGLDDFESCAHKFNNRADHGDHKALDCVKILVSTIIPEEGASNTAISELAKLLYRQGETFCDCSKHASDSAPLCPSFYNFKTLLYESLDACKALDEIDCDAWEEFHGGCKPNYEKKFGSFEVTKKEQCKYLEDGCDGAGPFPSFRYRDCESELKGDSWAFYQKYSDACLGDEPPPSTTPAPTAGKKAPATKHPTPNTDVNPHNIKPTAYVPAEDDDSPPYSPPDEKKSHWFRNLFLLSLFGGIGYYIYKRRADGFNFVRYRRVNMFGGGGGSNFDDGDMYTGFALESSTTFEPPSLPPTPMSMPNNGGYGYGYNG